MDYRAGNLAAFPAPTVPWEKILKDGRTGTYFNSDTANYEFRCFFDNTFVVVGTCPKIQQFAFPENFEEWETKCKNYVIGMLHAH